VLSDLPGALGEGLGGMSRLGSEEGPKMRAADVMTTDVITVGPDARVVEVAETLLASRGLVRSPLSESGVSWSGS
jgi:CBS domain-containing protein